MKKGMLFSVLFMSALLCKSIVTASELTDDYFDIATNYFNANNYTKSSEYLDLILYFEPDNVAAKIFRSKSPPLPPCKDESKPVENSEKVTEAAQTAETPQPYTENLDYNLNCYTKKGQEFYQKKEFNKAIKCFSKAIKLNPQDYMAYYYLGYAYQNSGKYSKAIQNYKEVVKINPKFSKVYLNLAICFLETGEFNYTLLALDQYKEFCPGSDFVFYLAAKANLALGHYEDAKVAIENALNINNCNEYQLELGKIAYQMENYCGALDIFQNLLQAKDSAEIYNYIGLCNYQLKNIEAAMADFKKAIDLDGLQPNYYYNMAQCYKSIGEEENYVKYLKFYEAMGNNLHYNKTKDQLEMRFNKK